MNRKLSQIFDLAEQERKEILKSIVDISPEQFFAKLPKKWSISQILNHIMLSERLSLIYMKKKSLGIDTAGDTGLIEDVKFLLLKFSQRLPLKFKAPEVLGKSEPDSPTLAEITAKWNNVRNEMLAFAEGLPEKYLKRKIYKHPVAGRLNIIQAIAFMREHVNHHLPQIKRLS
jgi:hypothetical protein